MIKNRLIFNEIGRYINAPEAVVLTGMRRTGKTTVFKYFFDKVPSENKLFLDLENIATRKYFEEDNYETIKVLLERLGVNFNEKAYIFLDEMQFIANLPSIVKYFIDHYKVKFFLTGSSSFYLKNHFSESLSGRKVIFELYPLTFGEFLIFKDVESKIFDDSMPIGKNLFEVFTPLYEEYIEFGGFPTVVLKETAQEKQRALEDIFTSYYQFDILQLGNFRKNKETRNLLFLLANRIGTKLDITKLSKILAISRPTVNEYLQFLNDTYFIKMISPFSRGRDIEIRKAPKIYLCDSGMANILAKPDKGRVFENSIFQNLIVKGTVNYYQRKKGAEIDFILNQKHAFEVKTLPSESDLRKLKKLATELELESYRIISKRYCSLPNIIYGFMV